MCEEAYKLNCFSKLYNGIQIVVHETEHLTIVLQKKQRYSLMKADASDVQRDRKIEVLAQKHSSVRPRPRPKTARTNR
jgi:hypothetical protein